MAQAQKKQTIDVKSFKRHEKDAGSPELQIARLTQRINELTEHMKENPKDYSTRRGLLRKVGQRRRLQNYYKRFVDASVYKNMLETLGLRK